MRILDANCFLGLPPLSALRGFNTAVELLTEMDDLGIEQALVCHAQAMTDKMSANRLLLKEIRDYSRLLPVWIVDPATLLSPRKTGELLQNLVDEGIRMVRLQPGPLNNFSPHYWAYHDLFAGLSRAGVILYLDYQMEPSLSHAAVPEYEWTVLHQLATSMPELQIVLFAPKLAVAVHQVMGLLRSCRNVMLDISSLQVWRGTELAEDNGVLDQFVFGSYLPFFDPGQFITQLCQADISKHAKDAIAHHNLANKLV